MKFTHVRNVILFFSLHSGRRSCGMNEIALELLNKGHLARYQDIDVMDAEDFGKRVWDSGRLTSFVGADHEGCLMVIAHLGRGCVPSVRFGVAASAA